MVYTVPFEELEDWLNAQPENTPDTPYELNILNLTEERLKVYSAGYTLAGILVGVYGKYVDLRSTKIPDTVKTLDRTFFEISNVVYSFDIPEGVEVLIHTYSMSGIKESPKLPDSLIEIYRAFESSRINSIPALPPNIKNIIRAFSHSRVKICKWLPEGIENLDYAFYWCQQLEEAYVPKNVGSVYSMFEYCPHLTKITIKAEAEDVLTLCGNDAEATIPVEGRVIYVEDTQIEQYRRYYKYFGLTSPDNVLERESGVKTLMNSLEDTNFITAYPSDESISIVIDPITKMKTVNLWNYNLEGSFSLSHKFPDTIISADLRGINFIDITSFSYMFFYCEKLRKLTLPKIDFKDRSVERMFAGCSALTQLDLSSMDITELTDSSEMFSLDNIVIYYNPLKWEMGFGSRFGNANNARFVPIEEIENKIFIDGKQVGTFYHDGLKYKKAIKQNRTYFLDDYGCLLGLSDDTPIPDSAWGENENGEFQAWVFSE